MKPFLGINLTIDKNNEQINGQEFLIQTPSAELFASWEASAEKAEKTMEKSQLPLVLRAVRFLCGTLVLFIIAGLLKSDVTLSEGYQNAPGLYWTLGICVVIWIVLWICTLCKSKAVLETDESAQIFSHVESVSDNIYMELGVPADAKDVDILMFFYKEKNGDIKVCEKGMQIAQYFNPVFKVYTDKEYLYLANLEGKYAFPLSSIVRLHTVKKRIRIDTWNKEEKYNKGIYKQYKLDIDNYDCIHCKTYHILEMEHDGESWGIYVPCYEQPIFEAIYEEVFG